MPRQTDTEVAVIMIRQAADWVHQAKKMLLNVEGAEEDVASLENLQQDLDFRADMLDYTEERDDDIL